MKKTQKIKLPDPDPEVMQSIRYGGGGGAVFGIGMILIAIFLGVLKLTGSI